MKHKHQEFDLNVTTDRPVDRSRYADGITRQARQFFSLAFLSLSIAVLIAMSLSRVFGKPTASEATLFPTAFAFSSLLLFGGSFSLHQATRYVRREKQRPFRRWLMIGLLCGTLFMGTQSYALWSLIPFERAHEAASLGVTAFVMCLGSLHGLHFLVAVLFVVLVITRAWADRYDHEYYWGVRICAWFWHFLGVLWVAILGVIAISLM